MRRFAAVSVAALGLVVACHHGPPPEVARQFESRTLYTCCNMHHESDTITDANYFIGTQIPLGTPVRVEKMGRDSATVVFGNAKLTLEQRYGNEQEPFDRYLGKILVAADPAPRVAAFAADVREAIRDGRVERGMTREQVILSLGYPPTHRTPSTDAKEWTYWYNRWVTYKVRFDDAGKVSQVIGRPAPTSDRVVGAAEDRPVMTRPEPPLKKRSR